MSKIIPVFVSKIIPVFVSFIFLSISFIGLGIVGSCEFTNERKTEILDINGIQTGKYTVNAKGTLYRKHLASDKKPAAFKDCETGELYQSIYARIIIKRK